MNQKLMMTLDHQAVEDWVVSDWVFEAQRQKSQILTMTLGQMTAALAFALAELCQMNRISTMTLGQTAVLLASVQELLAWVFEVLHQMSQISKMALDQKVAAAEVWALEVPHMNQKSTMMAYQVVVPYHVVVEFTGRDIWP